MPHAYYWTIISHTIMSEKRIFSALLEEGVIIVYTLLGVRCGAVQVKRNTVAMVGNRSGPTNVSLKMSYKVGSKFATSQGHMPSERAPLLIPAFVLSSPQPREHSRAVLRCLYFRGSTYRRKGTSCVCVCVTSSVGCFCITNATTSVLSAQKGRGVKGVRSFYSGGGSNRCR